MTLAKPEQRVALTTEQRRADLARRWQMIDRVVDRELERRRKRKRANRPSLATLRVCELNRLFYTRYRGPILPDDDDGRDSVEIMVNHLVMLPAARLRVEDWFRRCAPWLDQATADRLVARAVTRPIRWNADTLAQRLNLTSEERDRLKIRTIGAIDLDKQQRKDRRRAHDRQAKEAKRRAASARPQALSTSRTKPWIALGISRSKWYADRRAVREREMSGQFRRQYKTGSTVDGIVHTIDGSKAPEVVGSRSDSTSVPNVSSRTTP